MPTSITTLDNDFKNNFGISEVHWSKDSGGQKFVHCVTRNEIKCILKIYRNFNARDVREIKIYEKFKNLPNIPKIIEVKKYEKDTISFEEFIDGNCLDDIASSYKSKENLVATLLKDICEVMIPLWESDEQIVHRDIKPSNIIIKPDGSPVVIDFGIAKDSLATTLTSTGFQPNTWTFASPEQYENLKDSIHYRTDFFCIAAVGYYLLNSSLAFGNSADVISNNYKNKAYKVSHDSSCKLIPFFQETLSIAIAERPRTAKEMIKLLSI
jgi:eukaryotic-like serine/threonine-protein kinase